MIEQAVVIPQIMSDGSVAFNVEVHRRIRANHSHCGVCRSATRARIARYAESGIVGTIMKNRKAGIATGERAVRNRCPVNKYRVTVSLGTLGSCTYLLEAPSITIARTLCGYWTHVKIQRVLP
jgi:hypothetical protein